MKADPFSNSLSKWVDKLTFYLSFLRLGFWRVHCQSKERQKLSINPKAEDCPSQISWITQPHFDLRVFLSPFLASFCLCRQELAIKSADMLLFWDCSLANKLQYHDGFDCRWDPYLLTMVFFSLCFWLDQSIVGREAWWMGYQEFLWILFELVNPNSWVRVVSF